MKTYNKILGVLGVLSFAFGSVCGSVSAAEFTYNLPDSYFSDGASNSEYSPYLNSLKNNPNLSEFDSDKLIVLIGRSSDELTFFILDPEEQYNTSNSYEGVVFLGDYATFTCSASLISTYNFTVNTYNPDPLELQHGVFYNLADWGFDGFAVCEGQITDTNNFYTFSFGSRPAFYYASVVSSYEPTPSVDNPLSLNVDVDGFYNWLVETQKDSNFTSYFSLRNLSQYLQYYSAWGSAPQRFLGFYNIEFGDNFNAHLSNTQIITLKNLTDRLYREYLNSLRYPPSEFPARDRVTDRRDIDTHTTDNNTLLITDDSNDTIDITILRDILRGIIAIKNQIYVTGSDLLTGLSNLDFTVNVANNGGNFVGIDLSVLYQYDSNAFYDDLLAFESDIEDIQSIPQGYINAINQNSLMPENMLEDKNSLTVNVPCITGFTIANNGSSYSTQTGTYTLSSSNYPWLDPVVQKIKRFGSILLIIGYLVHLRFRIPELVRGE